MAWWLFVVFIGFGWTMFLDREMVGAVMLGITDLVLLSGITAAIVTRRAGEHARALWYGFLAVLLAVSVSTLIDSLEWSFWIEILVVSGLMVVAAGALHWTYNRYLVKYSSDRVGNTPRGQHSGHQ